MRYRQLNGNEAARDRAFADGPAASVRYADRMVDRDFLTRAPLTPDPFPCPRRYNSRESDSRSK